MLLLSGCFLLAAMAVGQDSAPAPGGPAAPELQQRIQSLEALPNLEPLQQQALNAFRTALELHVAADGFRATAADYTGQLEGATAEQKQLRATLAEPPPEPTIAADAKLEQLEQERIKAAAQLTRAQRDLQVASGELERRATFLVNGPQELAEVQRQRDALPAETPVAVDESENAALLAQAQSRQRAARREALTQQIAALEAQLQFFGTSGELLSLRRDVAAREVRAAEALVARYRDAVLSREEAEAARAREEAERARREALNQNPILRAVAEENQRLATERGQLVDKLRETGESLVAVETLLKEISDERETVQKQVEAAQFSNAVGALLRTKRSKLPNVTRFRRSQAARQPEIANSQFRAIALNDQIESFDPSEVLDHFEDGPQRERASELLTTQRQSLRELYELYTRYLTQLGTRETTESELIRVVRDYQRFIDEQILWTQSSRPIRWSDLPAGVEALAWFGDRRQWRLLVTQPEPGHAAVLIGLLAVAVALLLLRPGLRRRLTEVGEQAARPMHVNIIETIVAALWTTLLAAPVALLLLSLSWYAGLAAAESDLAAGIAAGCRAAALVLFVLQWCYVALRPKGLSRAHFGAHEQTARRLRWLVGWLIWPAVLLVLLLMALEAQPDDAYKDSLGRIAFGLAVGAWLVSGHYLLGRRGALTESAWFRGKAWLARPRWLWYLLALGLPVGLLSASLMGYQYTAIQLGARLALTGGVLLLTALVSAFARRWLLLTRRKLAIEQARQRRAARLEAGEQADTQPELHLEVDLPAMSHQTHQLLTTAILLGLALLAWTVWAPVLPALSIFDRIEVFNEVSLGDLALAVLATILTWLAVKNLPGLLEITILQHVPMDQSARHAATSLARYAILVIGVSIVFGVLGVGWDNVQWLVAAISVGLGFGLQEIFANFVSGLILMFERPIRLGDIVTVNGISGTVTRINTRATTIVDWDRKELIIPNREFVTGQIVNWSLSDSVIRTIVPVGVAYGSDTELARKLLLQVAAENKRILRDPAPRALFVVFGASSLDLELRCFVSSIDDWLAAPTELNSAIDAAFRAARIEIAFPQRDLHLRSVSPEIMSRMQAQDDATE